MRRLILLTCLSCLVAFAAAATACGDSNNTPITTRSPFNGSPPVQPPSGGSPSTVTQTPGAGGGAPNDTPSEPIKISVSNLRYDKSQLTASPGAIKIEFDNNDANVTHNFAVYKSSSDTSTPLGATPITSGPDKQTLSITLDQGEYYYQCEVHPQLMNGKLIVH